MEDKDKESRPVADSEEKATSTTETPDTPKLQHSATLTEWLLAKEQQRRLRIGISFRNLDCYGFRTSAQYQATFFSALAQRIQGLRNQRQRIQMLHSFEGLIRPGEMLLVLERPGSVCSSFLKALAGETYGFHLGADTRVNYQGKHLETCSISV